MTKYCMDCKNFLYVTCLDCNHIVCICVEESIALEEDVEACSKFQPKNSGSEEK